MNLENYAVKSDLFEKLDNSKIRCLCCNHRCIIPEGNSGFCRVRFNRGANLYVPYGYVSSLHIDPIEKKPVYHFMPSSQTLSFGMIGCNFRCIYCQNYGISQPLRENLDVYIKEITSDEMINIAIENNINVIVSTYNEPVITLEWAKEIFKKAKEKNPDMKTGFVSNGYITEESLNYIKNYIDFIRVDLKSFDAYKFRKLTGGAELSKLLDSIKMIYRNNIHIEIVTLLVPEFNDSREELIKMSEFIKSISPDIPWHITAFHPDYKMLDKPVTDKYAVENAVELAYSNGLRYVYAGNIYSNFLNTYCPNCHELIIRRDYMRTVDSKLRVDEGKGFCPFCGTQIYGVF